MTGADRAITVANDETMSALLRSAQHRIVVLAPAVTLPIARILVERWMSLGAEAVSVILDVDGEVYRLGYGDPEALALLEQTAARMGTTLNRQPGIRIGLIIADEQTLVYAPTPRLIEAGPRSAESEELTTVGSAATQVESNEPAPPNAVLLGAAPPKVEAELGVGGRGVLDQRVGLDKAERTAIAEVEADLKKNPPQKFDIARQVRVFNASFEFVEFELKGTFIDRKTVPIPKHLSGVTDDETRAQLKTSFTIIPPGHDLSGKALDKDKQIIAKQFLRQIRGYGTVILRSQKDAFATEVNKLEAAVEKFGKEVRVKLQQAIDDNRKHLVDSMLPLVKQNTPREWVRSDGSKPDEKTLRQFLDDDLKRAFGTADRLIKHMEVRTLFKGVTYESLTSKEFIKAARDALPELATLYDEFDAARGRPDDESDREPE